MKKNLKFLLLIIAMAAIHHVNGNELGVATGINSTFYFSYYSKNSGYKKADFFSPVEMYYRHYFTRFFGLQTALQYNKKTISESYLRTDTQGKEIGEITLEISYKFISLQVCPLLFHKFNKITADVQAGLNSDVYINQWEAFDGDEKNYRNKNVSPVVISIITGCGFSYTFRSHFLVGVRSRVSRTVTSLYKKKTDADTPFVNWYAVLFAGYEF